MFSLPWLEMSRFNRTLLSRLAIVAILIVPTLYGSFYLAANWSPTDRLDSLDAVVVNQDRGADAPSGPGQESDGERLEAGDELVDTLTDGDAAGFHWASTDVEDAAEGLADGRYVATLTIPADFSERLASTAGDDPREAGLTLETNDAYNFVIGQVANQILNGISKNLNSSVTAQYLDQVYIGFNDIHDNISEAADGAADLDDGLVEAHDGAGELADGAGKLNDAAGELSDGADQLSTGTGELADGAGTLASGADELAKGQRTAADSAGELRRGAGQVADGTGELAAGADRIADRVDELHDGAKAAADAAGPALDEAADDLAAAGSTTRGDLADRIAALQEAYPDDPDIAELARVADGIGDDLDAAEGRAAQARDDARGVASDARDAADRAQRAVHEVDGKIHELDDGARQVADGAGQLSDGLDELATAGGRLSSGADELATGAADAHSGAVRLADGAGQLDDGAGELAGAASQLDDGLGQLSDGASELARGLADGVKQIPTYDADDRDVRSEVVALPVDSSLDKQNAVEFYGEGLAPFFLPLALWIGGMVTYMVLNAVPPRAIATPMRSRRIAWAGYLPGAALGAGQALLVFAVVAMLLGFTSANWPATLGFAVLIAATFAAIHQMFVVWLGGIGRLAGLVVLVLQLATAGGTYPIETAPTPLQLLSPFLPMTHAVAGMRMLITGGVTSMFWLHLAALVAFAVGALVLSIIGVRRKRMVTMSRLHPSLQLA